jgi:heme A synthase
VALLIGLAAQIVLGGITVLLGLSAVVSTIHLVVALSILAGLVYVCAAPAPGESLAPVPDKLGRLATVAVAALAVQLVLGGYVRHAGAGLACPAFPLCDGGGFLPAHWLAAVHWTHRWLGVLLLGLFVHLAAEARPTALARIGTGAGLAAVAQVALGVAAVLLGLLPAARAAHAALGYTLWALAVWMAIRSAAASAGRSALAHGARAGSARAGVAR